MPLARPRALKSIHNTEGLSLSLSFPRRRVTALLPTGNSTPFLTRLDLQPYRRLLQPLQASATGYMYVDVLH